MDGWIRDDEIDSFLHRRAFNQEKKRGDFGTGIVRPEHFLAVDPLSGYVHVRGRSIKLYGERRGRYIILHTQFYTCIIL